MKLEYSCQSSVPACSDTGQVQRVASAPPDAGSQPSGSGKSVLRVEDCDEVRIGEWYEVPVVIWKSSKQPYWFCSASIPILGDLHEDREINERIGAHWHVDWRFVPVRVVEFMNSHHYFSNRDAAKSAKVVSERYTIAGVRRRRMQALREHPTFPVLNRDVWQKALEHQFKDATAKCNRCPHRGISLVGAPVVNGARVCPGHGLAWNVETGALAPRS